MFIAVNHLCGLPATAADTLPPTYETLKDLHLRTPIAAGGEPAVAIVAPANGRYEQQANSIRVAIERLTGVRVPVMTDREAGASLPLQGHRILLGNRSTNQTLRSLYDAYYTLLDLRYPGPGGFVLRTVHNPYGNGRNAIFVGGSDDDGVQAATKALLSALHAEAESSGWTDRFVDRITDPFRRRKRDLSLGRLMEIRRGRNMTVPEDLRQFETWEASVRYGSTGNFGWNSLSKRMAMYYMTGDPVHAREFLRLAFPDEEAARDLERIDGQHIENWQAPLSNSDCYNQHMMILYWDLIEESPVFSDQDRLRVTNAFARQLSRDDHSMQAAYRLTETPSAVGSRHEQWGAISLYCLGRYFQKYYPHPVWDQCVRGALLHFAPLHEYAWVHGESDNLFYYNTGIAPILAYLVFTGDRVPVANGVLYRLLRGQEALLSGKPNDRQLQAASLGWLHKAAYLTNDGRWLHYRDRTGLDTRTFRLGQSFWPEVSLSPASPTDLAGKWTIQPLPEPQWEARGSGLPHHHSFLFGSWRSAPDASGDFILLDGYNGDTRNPYHTFAILDLRLAGVTLLRGYHTQVLTSADGMVEPTVAMDAALLHREVLGSTATALGEVPSAAFCTWRRNIVQRQGRYALVVDDIVSRTDTRNMTVAMHWDTVGGYPQPELDAIRIPGETLTPVPEGWIWFDALRGECRSKPDGADILQRPTKDGVVLLRAKEPGAWLEMSFAIERDMTGEIFVDFLNGNDRGIVRVSLDGTHIGTDFEHFAEEAARQRVSFGRHVLAAGEHVLRVEAVGRHAGTQSCYIALSGLAIRPDDVVEAAPLFELQCADRLDMSGSGSGTVTITWTGPAQRGTHLRFFHLLARRPDRTETGRLCVRLAENCAVLALPEPAVAVAGMYNGIDADLAIVAHDHLYARALKAATVAGTSLLVTDAEVELDWDFSTGQLHLITQRDTDIRLPLAGTEGLRLDDEPVVPKVAEDGMTVLRLAMGRHVISPAIPDRVVLERVREWLAIQVAEGRSRPRVAGAPPPMELPSAIVLPALETLLTADIHENIADLIAFSAPQGNLIAVAAEKTIHVFDGDGTEMVKLAADGTIRKLCWWPQHELLLAGCADDQVLAFDLNGTRRWAFTSRMDPAVYDTAETHWFKTAPGHEGIHGLATGIFLHDKSQCFVGSASTVDIVDEYGRLVKRMPLFRGPVRKFAFLPKTDGSTDLLMAQWPNNTDQLSIINNTDLRVRQGFDGVPPGHTMVGGSKAQNRVALDCVDLTGNGEQELVSATNGTWNRLTVYSNQGKPLANAQFGPGRSSRPASTVRAQSVADLEGDGTPEIIVALAQGLVLAFDHQCRKLWARRMSSPPTTLCCVRPPGARVPWIMVGCEDGTVLALDSKGQYIRRAQVAGTPVHMAPYNTPSGPAVVVATSLGQIRAFAVGQ